MEYVYIKEYSGRTRKTYHTDKNCYLFGESEPQKISMEMVDRMDLEMCSGCDDSVDRHRGKKVGESIPSQIRNGRYEKK